MLLFFQFHPVEHCLLGPLWRPRPLVIFDSLKTGNILVLAEYAGTRYDGCSGDSLAPDVMSSNVLAPDMLAPDIMAPDMLTPDIVAPDISDISDIC